MPAEPRMPMSTMAALAAMTVAAMVGLAGCAAVAEPAAVTTPSATAAPAPVPVVVPTATPEPEPPQLCDAGSLVAIWAHYDDDLIFGHSRVTEALEAGWCVTIAYLSAGDAGRGAEYSLGREQGIRDAYDRLRGYDGQWDTSTDVLETGVSVEEWTPMGDPRLTLLSFRLVDGNLDGSGFASMGYESLEKLADGRIDTVRDVDGPQALTRDDITRSIAEIIADAHPDALLTGTPREVPDLARGDHSDHKTTASFARAAWHSLALDPNAVTYAVGYQSADYPANVTGDELVRKVDVFSAYAVQDPVTAKCRDLASCLDLRLFGAWLQREYSHTAAEVDLD